MPVYIHEPDALDKLAAVEHPDDPFGAYWLDHQRAMTRDDVVPYLTSFRGFLEAYEAEREAYEEWAASGFPDDLVKSFIVVDGWRREEQTLYGAWGYNRYHVHVSGEIVFLEAFLHCESCLARAREQGFRIG